MTEAPEPAPAGEPDRDGEDWKSSAGEFLNARLELFRLEARQAGRNAARRVGLVVFAVGSALLCWALVMAGLIGLIAALASWPWHFVALALGGAHLLAAGLALLALRKPSGDPFPLTRSELEKDREWLNRLFQKTPKPRP